MPRVAEPVMMNVTDSALEYLDAATNAATLAGATIIALERKGFYLRTNGPQIQIIPAGKLTPQIRKHVQEHFDAMHESLRLREN